MNGDSNGELITLNYGDPPYPYWYTIVMSFGTKPPNLSTDAGLNLQNSSYTYITSPGDVNHDGFNDLIVHVSYYLARLFLGGNPIPTEKAAQQYFSNYWLNSMHFGGRVGDINGDGLADICVGETAGTAVLSHIYIYSGTRTPVSVEEEKEETAEETTLLFTVSPNPTNGQISVQYTLPDSGVLRLEIYDILGQSVYKTIIQKEKGDHTELLDLSRLTISSGVYILSLELKQGDKILLKSLKLQYMK
jgi:hypothetical protein